ncbi:hypothetical protein [Rhodococcus jostii]|uniref:hypothetical protein n=1 Tax=Rhodococcus jostii TaxID=132919 RepID=UPI00363818C4
MTDTDHLFLSREEIRKLVALLREMPELVEELAVTITRQDRIGTPGSAGKRRGEEQPLPFNATAAEAADDLHTTLVAWVRHVCESRRVDYDGRDGTCGVARWLDRNVIALAMTEGSGEALDEIQYAMRRARWATDRPAVKSRPPVHDEPEWALVQDLELTAAIIARMCRTLGFDGLSQRRIKTLTANGALAPLRTVCVGKKKLAIYRVGDVITAHKTHATRQHVDQGREA